jgi:hypothetical protein
LIQAPTLPATILPQMCYGNMFDGCNSIKSANFPNITKQIFIDEVYYKMHVFYSSYSDDIVIKCKDGILTKDDLLKL